MCNYITVTYENVSDYKEGYIWKFSVKSSGYMLNNIHFVAFAISSQGCSVKFDAVLKLLIGSLVWICSATRLSLTGLYILKWVTVENIC